MVRLTFMLLVAGALWGCLDATPPPSAPESLDGNLRWWFAHQAGSTDAESADAVQKLATAGKADSRTQALKSQMARLEAADLAEVGLETVNDPQAARGFLVLNLYACTLDRLAEILISRDQATQYPGVYDAYDRTYTSDLDAWSSGAAKSLSWEVAMTATLPISDAYQAQLQGRLRRLPGAAPGGGDVLVYRGTLAGPARFATTSTSSFKQDYQVEIFWEQEAGRIFHAYGMWREMKVGGFNLTTEDNGMFNLLIDNLLKWDERTVELCR
jgi:hypothetical protein